MRVPVFALLLWLAAYPALGQTLTLSLAQAEERLAHNREILAGQRALEAARADVVIASQAPNPTLSYSATGINPWTGIGAGPFKDKQVDQTLSMSQLVERGGKRALRLAVAEKRVEAVAADLANTRREQRLMLHQAWYDLLAAEEKLRLLTETAALYEKSEEAARRRLSTGDIAQTDASRLRVEALRAKNDRQAAEAEHKRAQANLAYLIGEEAHAADLATDGRWPSVEVAGSLPDPRNRADVRAAELRVEMAARARELARRLTTRDFTVGAQVERYPPTPGAMWGISLSIPLFLRYGYEGEIARAETEYTIALEARERVLAQAQGEIIRARADLDAAIERRRRVEAETLPEARRVAEAAEFAYRKGAIGLTDLLDARRTLRAVELEYVAACADYAKARAAWLAATEWEMSPP